MYLQVFREGAHNAVRKAINGANAQTRIIVKHVRQGFSCALLQDHRRNIELFTNVVEQLILSFQCFLKGEFMQSLHYALLHFRSCGIGEGYCQNVAIGKGFFAL